MEFFSYSPAEQGACICVRFEEGSKPNQCSKIVERLSAFFIGERLKVGNGEGRLRLFVCLKFINYYSQVFDDRKFCDDVNY